MNAISSQCAQVLIVTDSFIEAADLTEALGPLDPNTVMHLREVHECCVFLEDPAFRPRLSVVSYKRSAGGVEQLVGVLSGRGSAIVLIDATPEEAKALGGEALSRPFTARVLTTLFDRLRITDKPECLANDRV